MANCPSTPKDSIVSLSPVEEYLDASLLFPQPRNKRAKLKAINIKEIFFHLFLLKSNFKNN
ncbi:hypothetical protein ACSXAK_06960 [Clostridium perfringens]